MRFAKNPSVYKNDLSIIPFIWSPPVPPRIFRRFLRPAQAARKGVPYADGLITVRPSTDFHQAVWTPDTDRGRELVRRKIFHPRRDTPTRRARLQFLGHRASCSISCSTAIRACFIRHASKKGRPFSGVFSRGQFLGLSGQVRHGDLARYTATLASNSAASR